PLSPIYKAQGGDRVYHFAPPLLAALRLSSLAPSASSPFSIRESRRPQIARLDGAGEFPLDLFNCFFVRGLGF
ncbi:hypothetical protein BHE74_00048444, partial [Ensete ventricosum]